MRSVTTPFSDDVAARAADLLAFATPEVTGGDLADGLAEWTVSTPEGRTYHVWTDANPDTRAVRFVNCTCTHGKNHMGQARCRHAGAVLLRVAALADAVQPPDGDGRV